MYPLINIHTHRLQPQADIQVLAMNAMEWKHATVAESQWLSVGIHPWQSNSSNIARQLEWMEEALQQANVIAAGEMGLDRHIDIPLAVQLQALNAQLELAKRYSKPVVFHSVRTTSDILYVCKQHKQQLPFIVHGFTGTTQEVQQLQRAGGYVSFGSKLLNTPSRNEALKQAYKLNALFFETDEAEVSIVDIYQKAAEILAVDEEQLKQDVYSCFCRIFGAEQLDS